MAKATGFALCVAGVFLLSSTTSIAQLQVNRETGALQKNFSASVEVKGYTISSNNGLLDPGAWNSLTDQGVEGWFEANPRDQQLTELNPFGFTDPSVGQISLGNAYAGTTSPPSDEDLTFQYSLTDGSIVTGTVDYVGAINDFVLRIDPDSGAANLELLSGNVGPFDIIGYSIFSDSGSLASENLTGLGEGWSAASPMPTAVAELRFAGSSMFTTGTTTSIGNIFTPGAEQDLRFEFATVGKEKLHGSVTYVEGGCIEGTLGDVDGNGKVEFADFLILSENFGAAATDHTTGDVNCNGEVDFADFLILSENFGAEAASSASASAPEPSTGLMAFFAAFLLAGISRKRVRSAAGFCLIGIAVVFSVGSNSAMALDFSTRMIVLDAANPGANATIDTALEARGILNGTVTNVNISEDVTGTVDFIDFAGDGAAFGIDNAYPNGVNNATQNDFAVQVNGFLEIPAGDWNIGFNSDDGGILTVPRVNFLTRTNENAPTGVAGELIFNAPRGQGTFTAGSFTVPAGQTLRTEFEVIMFERGGGDSLEVAILDGVVDNNSDWASFGFELGDGVEGWKLLENGPGPGDFNWDDKVDLADFLVLANNFGTGTSFAQGDNNGDSQVDLQDFVQLTPLLSPPAAAVPEPGSASLLSLASISLLLTLRRRRQRSATV